METKGPNETADRGDVLVGGTVGTDGAEGFLDQREVLTHAVAVLDADARHQLALAMQFCDLGW